MKVREIITIDGWLDGNWTYNQCYSDSIIEIGDSIPTEMDWDWYDTSELEPIESEEDMLITVKYYAPDADLDDDVKLLVAYRIWQSELIEERNI